MKTRTRRPVKEAEEIHDDELFLDVEGDFDLERFSDDELEELLFDEEPGKENKSIFNLPTMAGLSMIVVGIAYIFQQLGLFTAPFNLEQIVSLLPWLAGVLIILLGFGVLSWGPNKKKKPKIEKKVTRTVRTKTRSGGERQVVVEKVTASRSKDGKKRLAKSSDKKIAGVAGGIGEYFNIDPTLVRIAFVLGTIFSNGGFLFAYLLLSFVMPDPNKAAKKSNSSKSKVEERITIIRDK